MSDFTSPRPSAGPTASRSFGILSTFPPTECGIATFSAALAAGLVAGGASVDVVRCGTAPQLEDVLVVGAVGGWTGDEVAAAADALNATDAVIVQHEYGIFPGADGSAVVPLVAQVTVPTIVVAHTVLQAPTANQRVVLEQLCGSADAVVVMTETARDRLIAGYDVPANRVVVIPHGAATPPADVEPQLGDRRAARHLLTWGLLGPGKGIEWAIDAVASLGDLSPQPTYTVAGATHPKVLASSGDGYRRMLEQRVEGHRASGYVSFDPAYRELAALTELIRSADLVVLPYDSKEQVTSGVLVDAVAAGRPVVSTAFPHAVELLGSGAGLVVPQRDPEALAAAIRIVLTEPGVADAMAAEARRLAPSLSWAAVAERYDGLVSDLLLAGAEARR